MARGDSYESLEDSERSRRSFRALIAGCLCLALAACASGTALVEATLPEPNSAPPDEQAVERAAKNVMAAAKLKGQAEISEMRRALVSAPGDWLICLRSNVPPFQPYALFWKGNNLVHYRIAVVYDDCSREMYIQITG